jgi:transcriptional regulator with XRE-family HTH domain
MPEERRDLDTLINFVRLVATQGYTQRELARMAGVGASTVAKWVRNAPVGTDAVKSLAKQFGVDYKSLQKLIPGVTPAKRTRARKANPAQEELLLRFFRQLDSQRQLAILLIMEQLVAPRDGD